jgi:hypothetical protein
LNIFLGWEGALEVVASRVRKAQLGKNINARPEQGIGVPRFLNFFWSQSQDKLSATLLSKLVGNLF